ncbi:MAG: hypothetical protein NTZ27_05230 [Ignavibacteriales bacterium]|nr:hypothetical protein [Ignavibacteriales bacterium]
MIDINKLLAKEPRLTNAGIELDETKLPTNELPEVTEIQRVVDWLETRELKITKCAKAYSGSIKHNVEQEMKTYVSNGAVVAALVHLDIPYKTIKKSNRVNAHLTKNIFNRPHFKRKAVLKTNNILVSITLQGQAKTPILDY